MCKTFCKSQCQFWIYICGAKKRDNLWIRPKRQEAFNSMHSQAGNWAQTFEFPSPFMCMAWLDAFLCASFMKLVAKNLKCLCQRQNNSEREVFGNAVAIKVRRSSDYDWGVPVRFWRLQTPSFLLFILIPRPACCQQSTVVKIGSQDHIADLIWH